MFKWRKMTWLIMVTNAIFLIWIIGGTSSAHNHAASSCANDQFLSKQDCMDASNAGTAIGVGLIIFLWFLVFMVEAVIWFMTKPKPQPVIIVRDDSRA